MSVRMLRFFTAWLAWNTLPIRELPHFDPFPFPLLDVLLALEAILVASLILMRQSRMACRAEEAGSADASDSLADRSVRLPPFLGVDRQVAQSMGLHKVAADEEVAQLSQQTSSR